MNVEKVKIKDVIPNKDNPRIIKDTKFKLLVQSIKDFPEMLELRPIVVNSEMVVLGGNMRLKACIDAGLKEVPIIKAEDLTPEQQKEFIIKDNVGFGEWDWDVLANEFEIEDLAHWGIDIPIDTFEEEEKTTSPKWTKNITLTYSIEEAERIEYELYRIASTLEQAVQILLTK
jgi:hypothetical protein